VKHALADPSHTFTQPLYHSTKKEKNYLAYDWKKGHDISSTQLQHIRRETSNIDGKTLLRLQERRDFFKDEEEDPVSSYYNSKT
jgi:hypothetical protein